MNQGSILLIDKNKTDLLVLSQLFDANYDLYLSSDIFQAISIIKESKIDVLIVDVNENKEMALSFMNLVKLSSDIKGKTIVFLYNDLDHDFEEYGYKLGASEVISKSSRTSTIQKRIQLIIELALLRESKNRIEQEAKEQIGNIQQQIIESFSSIIEGRDVSTGMHIKRTASYVSMVLKGLLNKGFYKKELTDEVVDAITKSAPLHDIGKIAVSDTILCKPGKLTKEEFEIMKCHASEGGKLIKQTLADIESETMLNIAVNMATYHHEKWAGGGYPENLKGEQIPLCARVMAIVDVFDALVSKRCYKESFSYEQSFGIIKEEKGKHFDPIIADVFLDMKDQVVDVSESWAL